MKKILYKFIAKILTIIGDIKIFKFPLFLIYDPDDYQISGKEVINILDIIEPGDVLLRGYNMYLDGKFIPNKTGYSKDNPDKNIGKGFSHGAIYIGNNVVIHAIAEGVKKIHILDFLQCDRIAILRPKKFKTKAILTAKKLEKEDTPYDFYFNTDSSAIYCFELVKTCYPKLQLNTQVVSKLLGLIKKDVYIAQSFIDSPDYELIYCHNPKYNISDKKFT